MTRAEALRRLRRRFDEGGDVDGDGGISGHEDQATLGSETAPGAGADTLGVNFSDSSGRSDEAYLNNRDAIRQFVADNINPAVMTQPQSWVDRFAGMAGFHPVAKVADEETGLLEKGYNFGPWGDDTWGGWLGRGLFNAAVPVLELERRPSGFTSLQASPVDALQKGLTMGLSKVTGLGTALDLIRAATDFPNPKVELARWDPYAAPSEEAPPEASTAVAGVAPGAAGAPGTRAALAGTSGRPGLGSGPPGPLGGLGEAAATLLGALTTAPAPAGALAAAAPAGPVEAAGFAPFDRNLTAPADPAAYAAFGAAPFPFYAARGGPIRLAGGGRAIRELSAAVMDKASKKIYTGRHHGDAAEKFAREKFRTSVNNLSNEQIDLVYDSIIEGFLVPKKGFVPHDKFLDSDSDFYDPDLKAEGGPVATDPDIALYEELRDLVAAQARTDPARAALTHLGAKPTRTLPLDLGVFGQHTASAPYDVTGPLATAGQLAYDLKTLPFYFHPATAIPAALADVGEGLYRGDPLQTAFSALGVYGRPFAGVNSARLGRLAAGASGAAVMAPDPAEGADPMKLAKPWRSTLDPALAALKRRQPAPLAAWEKDLAAAGAKKEELAWTLRGAERDKPVTLDELRAKLAEGRVEPGEKVLGSTKYENSEEGLIKLIDDASGDYRLWNKIRGNSQDRVPAWSEFGPNADDARAKWLEDNYDEPMAWITGEQAGYATATKFAQQQLPGGANYRELLVTMPTGAKREAQAEFVRLQDQLLKEADHDKLDTITTRMRELQESQPEFVGGHYDDPNVLAHVRFNDRVAPDGSKTLFIEELQSDWHLKGRKEGYQTATSAEKAEHAGLLERYRHNPEYLTGEENERLHELDKVLKASGSIPDAPLKSSWPAMAFRRMVKHAADNGYDRVAWISGEETAKRYDLSKHLSKIEWSPEDKALYGYDLRGNRVLNRQGISPEKLQEYIGKDAAEKIIKQPLAPRASGKNYKVQALSGLDLKVGGKWAYNLYDKYLPEYAASLGKKYGAKVESIKLGAGVDRSGTDFEVVGRDGELLASFSRRDTAEEMIDRTRGASLRLRHPQDLSIQSQSMKLTPALVKAAREEGFNFFSVAGAAGAGAGAARQQEEGK